MEKKSTDNVGDIFYQYLLHDIDRIIRWIAIIAEAIHQAFHFGETEISVKPGVLTS